MLSEVVIGILILRVAILSSFFKYHVFVDEILKLEIYFKKMDQQTYDQRKNLVLNFAFKGSSKLMQGSINKE